MEYEDWVLGQKKRRTQFRAPIRINYQGYRILFKPDHPRARKDGYVLESVYLWEIYNRACLLDWARIFHKNRNKLDNNQDNIYAKSGVVIKP